MFLDTGGNGYLHGLFSPAPVVSIGNGSYRRAISLSAINNAFLDDPYPNGEGGVEDEVCDYGPESCKFSRVPAILPIRVEEYTSDSDSRIAKR